MTELEKSFNQADQENTQKPFARSKQADSASSEQSPQEYDGQTLDEETQKGNYHYRLQQYDIADIARLEYHYGIEGSCILFEIVGSPQQLSHRLEQFQTKISQDSETRPLTLIVNLGYTHWVTLVIAYQSRQFYGYYADSLGHKMPNDIHQTLRKAQITPMDFHSYLPTPQQTDGHNCGLWALENAANLNKMLQDNQPLSWAVGQLEYQRDEKYFEERRRDFAEKLRRDATRVARKEAYNRLSLAEHVPVSQAKKSHLQSELRQTLSNQQPVKPLTEMHLPVQQPGHSLQQKKSKIPRLVKISHQNNQNKRPPIEGNEPDDALPDTKVFKVDLPDEKETYSASGLKSSLHGTAYQLKLLMLFLKRGSRKYRRSFRLATEMDAVEKFDDVVFQYSKESKLLYRALQAKHKQDETQKITANHLLTEKDDEFSLQKYFISYRRIQRKLEFKSGTWEDFTICTNIDFDFDDQKESSYLYLKKLAKEDFYFEKIVGSDDILNIGGERYRFVSDQYKEKRNQVISKLKQLFEKTCDLKRLAKLLAEYILIKKDKKGNAKTIGLNEKLFKTYQGALTEEVIDIYNKKFHDDFVNASQSLSPPAKLFRDVFREAVETCLKSERNLSAQNEKILQTLSSESSSKIPKLCNAQQVDKESAVWREMKKIELNLSDHFGKILKIESNPELTDSKQLAEEIARLIDISKKKSQVVVKIVRNKPVIIGNIDKFAGYVWVKKEEKIHFSTAFLNKDQLLSSHLEDFRNHLKTALLKKGVSFDTLNQYQFNIANFQTCKEEELEEYLNSKPTLPNDSVIFDREIEDFLNKLVFAVNQPNEEKLGEIINKEIGKEFNLIDADLITNDFLKKMWDWMKEKQGTYLSENKADAFFKEGKEKIAKLVLIGPTSEYSKKIRLLGVTFKELPQELKDFLTSEKQKQIFNLIAPQDTQLSAIKVSQALQDLPDYEKEDSYIFIRLGSLLLMQDRVLKAFRSKTSNNLLVIECKAEKNTQGLYKELSDIIEKQSSKKIILITKQNDDFSDNFKVHLKYVGKIDESEFGDLTEASQNKLLKEKTVVFQGCEISLGQLIEKNPRDIIDLEALSKLVSKEDKIVIGSALSSLGDIEHYYIDRTFNHRIKIKDDCFKAEDISDLFAISGVAENAMAQLCSGKKIRWFGETDPDKNKPIQFIMLQNQSAEENFKQLCRDYSWHTIHWLKKSGNGLIWQKSQGFLTKLINYVERDDYDLPEIKDRVTIIADTPGMGKSTILTYLAAQEKASNPALWVIRINLVDHVDLLDSMNFRNEDKVIDFLSDAEKLKTELEIKLLHYCLSQQDKIALFLDGFDEISPTYKEKVIQLLKILKNTSLEKIWITTRPHMQHELEDKLQVFSYVLKPFSPKDQERFLKEFWKKHLNLRSINEQRLDVYTQELIDLVTRSIRDREKAFTGVPLQTRMLAEAFQEDFKMFYGPTGKVPKLPEKLDLLDLYQRFIQSKYKIFYEEKKKDNINNPAQTLPNEIFEKIANQKHARLACDTLFHGQVEFDANEDTLLQELLSSVSDEELSRIGIVQVINDKPNFIHRTFAEYFVAQWFAGVLNNECQNKDSVCKFLKERIFTPDNEVLRNFFDRILAKDFPVLTATLNNDKKTIIDLLSEKPPEYINSIDNQGRTALHLAAAYNHEEIVKELLRNNAKVNIADKILEWSPLSYADKNGYWNIAELLLQKGAKGDDMLEAIKNVNLFFGRKEIQETLLHIAAREGYIELAKVLIEHGAAVNFKGCTTPLHNASWAGHLNIVQYLVAQGAKIDAFSSNGLTSLMSAASVGHLDIVQYLVTQGANVNTLDKDDGDIELYGPCAYYGQIPLCSAVSGGHLEVVKYLIEQGAKVNTYDRYGITPLFSAAERGHFDIVQYLVAQGAEINAFDNEDLAPLLSAALRGHLDIVQYLVMQGANVNALDKDDGESVLSGPDGYYGQIPLYWAVTGGHLEIVKYLIEQGAKVNTYDQYGITPLSSAAELGFLDIAQYLVEQSADINIRINNGITPFTKAAESGHLDMVKYLIERGADVNIRDSKGWTPLARAASYGHSDVVELIIEKGADVLTRNDHDTVLHQAVSGNNPEVIKSILNKIKEKFNNNSEALYQVINAEDTEGDTPLIWAAEAGKTNAVRILLEYGSDFMASNQKGMTALHWAVKRGYLEVVRLLRAHNADPTLPDKDGKTPLDLAQEQLSNNPQTYQEILNFLRSMGHQPAVDPAHPEERVSSFYFPS